MKTWSPDAPVEDGYIVRELICPATSVPRTPFNFLKKFNIPGIAGVDKLSPDKDPS